MSAGGLAELARARVEGLRSGTLAKDGLSATIVLDTITRGHVHAFDLGALRSRDKEELLHRNAYYTVNEVPTK